MPNFPKCGFNTRHDNREVTLIEFFENRICANIYQMFRCVDWAHDMIIVKWHLFIRHERKLWSLTNAPPVQSMQTGQWLSTLFHANCSAAQVYVLYPRQFIFAPSCRRRPFLQLLQFTEHSEGHFEKFFMGLMMTNVMVKTCLYQKIIKNSNLIQAMKNSVCPTPNVTRRPIFSESRIFWSFRIVDSKHDMTIVKRHLLNFSKAEFVRIFCRIFTECSEVWINTRHDNREVTLIHLTRAQTLRSDKCATGSIHANGSMTINVIPC